MKSLRVVVTYSLITYILFITLGLKDLQAQKLLFTQPEKLPNTINGSTDVDFPMFAPDGSFLFFSRTGDGRNTGGLEAGSDIWFTRFDSVNNSWSEARNDLGLLNNELENAVVGIRADAKRIYLYNSYIPANPSRVSLCYSDQVDGAWSKPELLNIGKIDVGLDPYGLFMNREENGLFISMKGSYGNEDLFVSIKDENGKWSKPLNLGPQINSSGYDFSPFLDHTGKNLYFASDGRSGNGGTDIYVSNRLDDTWKRWSTPINLGSKINSSGDEIYFTMTDKDLAFFSTKAKDQKSVFYQSRIRFLDSAIYSKMVSTLVQTTNPEQRQIMLISRLVSPNGPARSQIEVLLVDEDGTVLDRQFTNSDGAVVFKNLDSQRQYKVITSADMPDLQISNVVEPHYESINGLHFIASEQNQELRNTNAEGKNFNVIARLLDREGNVSVSNAAIQLFTDDTTLLDRAFSDADGKVIFKTLSGNKSYKLRIESSEQDLYFLVAYEPSEVLLSVEEKTQKAPIPMTKPSSSGLEKSDYLVALYKINTSSAFGKMVVVKDQQGTLLAHVQADGRGFVRLRLLSTQKSPKFYLEEVEIAPQSVEVIDQTKWKKLDIPAEKGKGFYLGFANSTKAKGNASYDLHCTLGAVSQSVGQIALILTDENGEMIAKGSTNEAGELIFRNLPSDRSYKIFSDDALPSVNISLAYYNETKFLSAGNDSEVRPPVGKLLVEHVLYSHNSAEATIQQNTVKTLKALLEEYPTVQLILIGHTDQKGSDSYNHALSLKRAENLKNELITTCGISPKRIYITPKGETQPHVNSENEEVPENRRVEVQVKAY